MRKALIGIALTGTALGFLRLVAVPDPVRDQAGEKRPIRETVEKVSEVVSSLPAARPSPEPSMQVDRGSLLLREAIRLHGFGRDRQACLRQSIQKLSEAEIKEMLAQTFGAADYNDITHVLLERLAAIAPEAAISFGKQNAQGENASWWFSIVGGLSSPQTALREVSQLASSEQRTDLLSYIAQRWARGDRFAALHYAQNLAPPEARSQATINAIVGIANADKAAGLALAAKHAASLGYPRLVTSIAIDWAASDFLGALKQINSMSPGNAQQLALEGVSRVAIERDPALSSTMIRGISDPRTRKELSALSEQALSRRIR